MSAIDKIRDFESRLPEELKKRIDSLVDQITEQMDVVSQREMIVDKLIQDFIMLCDEIGLPREQTSVYIKHKLKGIVSDDAIERRLPKDRKRQQVRYHDSPLRSAELPHDLITVTPFGRQEHEPEPEPVDEPLPTNEEILETSVDMALAANDDNEREIQELKIRLREALDLADKKQEEIEKMHLQIGEFEFQLRDARNATKETGAIHAKDAELTDRLISEYTEEIKQLKEALREKIKKETFVPAAEVEPPKTVWIAALNCFGLSRSLMQISMKLTDQSTRGKVLFDIAIDGSIKNPRLETAALQEN